MPHLNCTLLNLHTLIIHRLSINMAFQRNLCVTGENSASCRHAQSKESQTRPNAGGISLTGESTVWMDIRSMTEWLCCIMDCHSTASTEDGKAGIICQWSASKFQGISWLVYLVYEQKWPDRLIRGSWILDFFDCQGASTYMWVDLYACTYGN